MRGLSGRIEPVATLPEPTRAEMWSLFARYYADVDEARFAADLARKHDVILLRDRAGALQGFSTLARFEHPLDGRLVTVVFSGDTVVDRAWWGNPALHLAFTRYVMGTWLRRPLRPVYWLLITKGWRTYLLLTRFFVRYWPRPEAPTPPGVAALLDTLARRMWPDAWHPESGTLRFATPQGRLKEEVAPVTDALLADPDIRFFVEQNPGHAAGDELVCLGGVGLDFAGRTALRVFTRLFRGRRR